MRTLLNKQKSQLRDLSVQTLIKPVKVLLLFCLLFQVVPASFASEPKENENLIIEAIVCEGNEYTDSELIKKELYLNEGDILDPDKIFDAELRLGAKQQFRDVHIYLRKGERRGYVVVVISVKEGSQIQTEVSLDMPGQIRAKVTDYNFFGTSRTFEARIKGMLAPAIDAEYFLFGLTYTDQQFLGKNSLFYNISLGADTSKKADKKARDDDMFFTYPTLPINVSKTEIVQKYLNFNFGRRVGRFSSISAGWGFKNIRGREWYDPPAEDNIKSKYIGEEILNIFLNYEWNTMDDTVFPTKGSEFLAKLSLGGEKNKGTIWNDDVSFYTKFTKYWKLKSQNTISFSLSNSLRVNVYNYPDKTLYSHTRVLCKYMGTIRNNNYYKKIINASWYFGAAVNYRYYTQLDDKHFFYPNVQLGVIFETSFGIFNFYLGPISS